MLKNVYFTFKNEDKEYNLSLTQRNPDGFILWLENQDGEGISLSEKDAFNMLYKKFREDF